MFPILLAAVFLVLFCAITSVAEPEAELRVGVREVRPFIFLDENQQPSGYSITFGMPLLMNSTSSTALCRARVSPIQYRI